MDPTAPPGGGTTAACDYFTTMIPAYADDNAASSLPTSMRLGACYNLFDGEELLEASIRSIRSEVDFVCVVTQTVSNFGQQAHPRMMRLVQQLVKDRLIDKCIQYKPRRFSPRERKRLVSVRATGSDLGGAAVDQIGDQFFNELTKREIGRQACCDNGCTHFMSMDADECYVGAQLRHCKQRVLEDNADGCLALMRCYYKLPTCELLPRDDTNYVPVMYRCASWLPFRLGAPYPFLCDPTRKTENLRRLLVFPREELEMHHFSWIRRDPSTKVRNSSNCGSFQNVEEWLQNFSTWQPGCGVRPPLPHPTFAKMYTSVGPCEVPGAFGIDSEAAQDASRGRPRGQDSWYSA